MDVRGVIAVLFALGSLSACSGSNPRGSGLAGDAPGSRASNQSPEVSLPARWWIWAESAGNRNPISDRTGNDCGINQPDDVWFLAGTFGGSAERRCTIPAGQPIFFPVMNLICEVVEGADVGRALDECAPQARVASASLDDVELEIVSLTSEGSFAFEAGPTSVIALPNSRFEAVAGGQWVGPVALTSGRHVLRFAAQSDDIELEVTYQLTVQ
jgi:hypothetical protein